jgi:hypothetical protein
MKTKPLSQYSFPLVLFLCALFFLPGCAVNVAIEQPSGLQAANEPATPTPEVFQPLDPAPTPVVSSLPQTCQVTDLNVYVDEERGYCFAYPLDFSLDTSAASQGTILLQGPALDQSSQPIRASLELTAQPVPGGSNLDLLAAAYLNSLGELSVGITQNTTTLGGEPAVSLEPVPGILSSRVFLALHNDVLLTLRFHPVDMEAAKPDLEALTQTLSGSFSFLMEPSHPESQIKTIRWYEFGQNISLAYDSILAPWVDARSVPAVPVSDQILFAEAQPAYAQIRFNGFQGGRLYDLPLLPYDSRMAQVRIFRTADFPVYGDGNPLGFVGQQQELISLLESGLDPARCSQPYEMGDTPLPYLPWINYQQVFCAQPQILEFSQGRGVRYITYFAQGPSPALDYQIFYTFQGLSEDGQFYVSAFFPLGTGIFPMEAPPCPNCGQPDYNPFPEWRATLIEQVNQLNTQPAKDFEPSLDLLDALVQSIQIGQ